MKQYKGRYINEAKMFRTCPDRAIEIPTENVQESGMTELRREIDAWCFPAVMEKPKRSVLQKAAPVVGTAAIFMGAAAAVIYLAPALGTILFAMIAWLMFAAAMTEKQEEQN